MRSLVVGIMLATASVYADPAPTAPTEEAKARGKEIYTAGTKQYDLRDYAAAIQSFRQAYDLIQSGALGH